MLPTVPSSEGRENFPEAVPVIAEIPLVLPSSEGRGKLGTTGTTVWFTVEYCQSARKVSSDAVGLFNRANGLPEGSGTGRGGRGGRVHHHQAEGLGAGGTASRHRRCMRRLQEGRGRSRMRVWDRHGLRLMQVGQAALQLGKRAARAEEAHRNSGELGGSGGRH